MDHQKNVIGKWLNAASAMSASGSKRADPARCDIVFGGGWDEVHLLTRLKEGSGMTSSRPAAAGGSAHCRFGLLVPVLEAKQPLSEVARHRRPGVVLFRSCGSIGRALLAGIGWPWSANCRLRRRNKKGRKIRPFLNIHLPAGTSMVRPRTAHV